MRRLLHRCETGFTLVEVALTCALVAIVIAAAFPVVPLFFNEANIVQNTYGSLDQLVLASETVTRYVHEAVDPSPTSTTYPFASASANAVTFFANTGLSTGPEEVVVTVTSAGGGRTFTADIRAPVTSPSNTCPFSLSSVSLCTYSTTATRSILLINNLTNGSGGSPVFTYTLNTGSTCGGPPPGTGGSSLTSALTAGTPYTSLSVAALTTAVASGDTIALGTGSSTQTVTASAAAAVGAHSISISSYTPSATIASGSNVYDQSCSSTQLGEIEAVAINLQTTKNPGGQPTGYQSLAYLLSPSYSTSVG